MPPWRSGRVSAAANTARDLLRYHYGFLRGGARAFGKDWGTSIYGQCDPRLSPEAVTLAYDMGARYVWFWTSDHEHHLPWPEQLELARTLKEARRRAPAPILAGPRPAVARAIVLPYGSLVSLEDPWWIRSLDQEGKAEASRRHARLMGRLMAEYHRALDAGEELDITFDDGRPFEGYRTVVRIGDGE